MAGEEDDEARLERALLRHLQGESDVELDRADLRERLQGMKDVMRRLDVEGVEARRIIATARRSGGFPGEERIESTIRRLAAESAAPGVRPPIGRRRWWIGRPLALLAAASVLLVLALWWRSGGEATDPAPILLSGSRITVMSPSGEVGRYDAFEWRYDAPLSAGRYFEVAVYDASGADPLVVSPHLQEASWSPAPDVLVLLPPRMRWEVTVRDAVGQRIESAAADASLRSP